MVVGSEAVSGGLSVVMRPIAERRGLRRGYPLERISPNL